MNIDIGTKIRTLRKSKNLNLSELSKKTNLSTGLISQIERNKVVPSVVSLWKIAQGLDVSVGYFFEEESANVNPVVKKDQRKCIMTKDTNNTYELLCPDLTRKIEMLYITLDSGETKEADMISHDGEECGVVLKGRMKVLTTEEEYILEEGDSIYLDSTVPHRYVNDGDDPCISIWAMTPPSF